MAACRTSRTPKAKLRRLEMKQLLIVLSLLVASAAPAAALEFNFDTIHVFGR
jgi:hypothetical protein